MVRRIRTAQCASVRGLSSHPNWLMGHLPHSTHGPAQDLNNQEHNARCQEHEQGRPSQTPTHLGLRPVRHSDLLVAALATPGGVADDEDEPLARVKPWVCARPQRQHGARLERKRQRWRSQDLRIEHDRAHRAHEAAHQCMQIHAPAALDDVRDACRVVPEDEGPQRWQFRCRAPVALRGVVHLELNSLESANGFQVEGEDRMRPATSYKESPAL
mmetsp:Transcript_151850/g.487288  ORF Transcript_151850/g.487288 Transcript_151850/m.487288 type:complete len:215 (+) Transcript_151850:968-1612(+)